MVEFLPEGKNSVELVEIQALCHNLALIGPTTELGELRNTIIPRLIKVYENCLKAAERKLSGEEKQQGDLKTEDHNKQHRKTSFSPRGGLAIDTDAAAATLGGNHSNHNTPERSHSLRKKGTTSPLTIQRGTIIKNESITSPVDRLDAFVSEMDFDKPEEEEKEKGIAATTTTEKQKKQIDLNSIEESAANEQQQQHHRHHNQHHQTTTQIVAPPHLYSVPDPLEVACRSIFTLYTFLRLKSPLTLDTLDESDLDSLLDSFEIEEQQLHFQRQHQHHHHHHRNSYNNNNNNNNKKIEQEEEEDTFYVEHYHKLVKNAEERAETLLRLYQLLPASSFTEFKSKVAFALALHFSEQRHDGGSGLEIAESLLFESIYIIDKTQPIVRAIAPIASEFGVRALSEYGNILLKMGNYQHAVLALEAASQTHKLVYFEENATMLRELAFTCWENSDWARSFKYFQMIYDKAKSRNELTEVVHISEIMSKMFVEKGDFRSAEEYMVSSVKTVQEAASSSSSSSSDDIALKIQLKLSQLYLQSYYFERGIELLTRLMDDNLPPIQQCSVLCHLALAYLKKKWLSECEFVLSKLGPMLTQAIMIRLRGIDGFDEIKLIEIATKCNLHQGRHVNALLWADEAIQRCTPASVQILGRFHYLRGKILHALSKSDAPIQFPFRIVSDTIHKDPLYTQLRNQFRKPRPQQNDGSGSGNSPNSSSSDFFKLNKPFAFGPSDFRHHGDLLVAGLDSFQKAFENFRVLGDQVMLAKTAQMISKAALDFVFVPISQLNFSAQDVLSYNPLAFTSNSNNTPPSNSSPLPSPSKPRFSGFRNKDQQQQQQQQQTQLFLLQTQLNQTLPLRVFIFQDFQVLVWNTTLRNDLIQSVVFNTITTIIIINRAAAAAAIRKV